MSEKLKYLTLLIGMMFSLGIYAQSVKNITGTVADSQGEPIIGANILVKGATSGTITDVNGHYSLTASANSVLLFSFVGYDSKEVRVGAQSVINVTLVENQHLLDEVVVVGYGTMRKSDLTGSISTAKGADIIKSQSFNALDGLKGKVAGVNIFSNTGQPGGEMRVVIRGLSTINASASPLYVVDGVVMTDF